MQLLSIDGSAGALCNMTAEQLLYLGSHHVVYLKGGVREDQLTYTLYGAGGNPLRTFDTIEEAMEMVAANGLSFATVH